jgi:N-acetylneuraminic acid mutarotase
MNRIVILFFIGFLTSYLCVDAQTISVLPLSGQLCSGGTSTISFTTNGTFNSGNQFIVQLSDAAGSFTAPSNIGSIPTTTSATATINLPLGLNFGVNYQVRIVSTNPVVTSTNTQALVPENTVADSWVRRTDLIGAPRAYAMAFSIGNKGYLGTGSTSTGSTNGFWEYDANTDKWTAIRNFGGFVRSTGVAFSIGNKGYCATGNNNKDLWEYDPETNTWTQKADLPGNGRSGASGFSIGNKGYIGLGKSSSGIYNDFWQYNPQSNTWQAKANFPGSARDRAVGFSIENKGYFGLGNDGVSNKSDLWEYNPSSDTWVIKSNFPGGSRLGAVAFSIGNKGYVGTGYSTSNKNDFYEFNPTTNTWTQKANLSAVGRRYAVGFSIGSKGFISTGIETGLKNDLLEYSPEGRMVAIPKNLNPVCPGSLVSMSFNTGCINYPAGNIFTVQLSDTFGTFQNPLVLGTVSATQSGTITFTVPSNLNLSNHYQIQIIPSIGNSIGSPQTFSIRSEPSITLTSLASTNQQEICVNSPISNITYQYSGATSIVSTGLPTGVTTSVSGNLITLSGIPTISNVGNVGYGISLNGGCIPVSANGSILVKPLTAISAEPSLQPVSYCEGYASSSLNVVASGYNNQYQWYANGVNAYSGSTQISAATNASFFPSTITPGVQHYFCVVNGACGLPDTTSITGAHFVKSNGTWLGTTTYWSDSINWCGGVPNINTNVTISAASAQSPEISVIPAYCNNLTIENGAMLIIDSQLLKVKGVISANAGIDATEGKLDMVGSARQNLNASSFIQHKIGHLKISNINGVEIIGTDTINIRQVLSFGNSNCTLLTNGKLNLMSDENGTASVADLTADEGTTNSFTGNQIVGNVIVERYIPNHAKAWQLLAAPATGKTIKANWQEGNSTLGNNKPGYGTVITSDLAGATSPALGFDIFSAAGPSMKSYNAASRSWEGVSSTLNNIDNPKGYMVFVRGDRSVTAYNQAPTKTTLRTTGKLYQPIGNPPATINAARDQFVSVGNPYASALDMTKLIRTGGVQDVYYVWDPKLTSSTYSFYGYGTYRTLVRIGEGYRAIPADNDPTSHYDVSNQNVRIQSGQAFFIHADSATGPGTLAFTESAKVLGSATTTRANDRMPKLFLNLKAILPHEEILLDGTMIAMDDRYSKHVHSEDALKWHQNNTERFSVERGGKNLTADFTNLPNVGDTIALSFEQSRKQNYTIQIMAEALQELDVVPVLGDRFTGIQKEIMISELAYSFEVNENPASANTNRFYVYFKPLQPLPVSITKVEAVRKQDSEVLVTWQVAGQEGILGYDVLRSSDGVRFAKIGDAIASNQTTASYRFLDETAPSSLTYYRILARENAGVNKYSNIVKVNAVADNKEYKLYTNPLTNGIIKIKIKDAKTQLVNLQLQNQIGQIITTETIHYTANSNWIQWNVGTKMAKGQYNLKLTEQNGNVISFPILIQ